MKIDEAIEILTDYAERLPLGVNDDYINANKLGREALNRLKKCRRAGFKFYCQLMPGETEGSSLTLTGKLPEANS